LLRLLHSLAQYYRTTLTVRMIRASPEQVKQSPEDL